MAECRQPGVRLLCYRTPDLTAAPSPVALAKVSPFVWRAGAILPHARPHCRTLTGSVSQCITVRMAYSSHTAALPELTTFTACGRYPRRCQEARRSQAAPGNDSPDHPVCPAATTYALPTTGVNHGCISRYDRHVYCCGRLARWQCAAPAVLSRAEGIALPAHHARVAQFGVRQPCCRASRAHDPARGIPLTLRGTRIMWVLVTIIASVRNARRRFVAIGSRLRTIDHGQPLLAVERVPARRLEACATGSACSPA